MKIVLFGATGMIGQGVLRECLLAPDVEVVLSVGRNASGREHPKLRELVRADLFDWSSAKGELAGYDACFFCLGISSAGMSEERYRKITYDLTLAAAQVLVEKNPAMTFIYVSGASTDSTGEGKTMWARVKGRTENALLALPFRGAYMFRPGLIVAMNGEVSRTPAYRYAYMFLGWLAPLLAKLSPKSVTTTEKMGRAMLNVARHGAPQRILEVPDINAAAERT